MAGRRYRRVLVQVTDDEITDESINSHKLGSHCSTSLIPLNPNCYTDIEILSYNTLSLSKKNHRGNINLRANEIMSFDCVGRTGCDRSVRGELEHMFDMLIFNQRNCCLIHFKPSRKSPTNFFNQILIPEVDKRLALLRDTYSLKSIKLEYYDVQKYDVVNMFEKSRNLSSKKSPNLIIFNNTRELLLWTTRHYAALWNNGSEHDSFDMEFAFVDAPNEIHGTPAGIKEFKVRLSLLHIYLNKMDWNMRGGLQMFFKSMHQSNLRVNHSIVTDCLREYFFNQHDQWHVWMLFSVPQVNYGTSLVNYMLSLAGAACGSFQSQDMPLNDNDMELRLLERNEISNATRLAAGRERNVLLPEIEFSAKLPPDKTFPSALSFWYYHINEGFNNVIECMEKYYDRKYKLKIEKMLKNSRPVSRTLVKDIGVPNLGFLDDNSISNDQLLQMHLKEYRQSLSDYRKILRKIERTKYADQLKISIATKNHEIARQTRIMSSRSIR